MAKPLIPFTKAWRTQIAKEAVAVGVCQRLWTPTVVAGDVVLTQPSTDLANLAVEVAGLSAPANMDIQGEALPIAIDNGMVIVFNMTGNAVAVLGA